MTRELGSGILASVFLVSLFHRFNRPGVQVLRWAVFAGLLGVAVIGSLWTPSGMRVAPVFWPVVVLYATAYFYILRERLNLSTNFFNGALTTLFVAYNALPLLLTMKSKASQPYPRTTRPSSSTFPASPSPTTCCAATCPGAPPGMASAPPCRCRSMWTSSTTSTTSPSGSPPSTSLPFPQPSLHLRVAGRGEASWFNVQTGNVPGDFPLREGFLLGGKDHVFLTDAQRVQKDKERRTGIR